METSVLGLSGTGWQNKGSLRMSLIRKFDFSAPDEETPDDRADANRQTASLAGLAVALLLVVAGLYIIRVLHAEAALEDCLMSGQRGCVAAASQSGYGGNPRLPM
jgi:hypothetical protein